MELSQPDHAAGLSAFAAFLVANSAVNLREEFYQVLDPFFSGLETHKTAIDGYIEALTGRTGQAQWDALSAWTSNQFTSSPLPSDPAAYLVELYRACKPTLLRLLPSFTSCVTTAVALTLQIEDLTYRLQAHAEQRFSSIQPPTTQLTQGKLFACSSGLRPFRTVPA